MPRPKKPTPLKPRLPRQPPRPRAPSLASVQRRIAQAVSRPLGAGETMRRENVAVAKELIAPNDRLSAFERLQIYNQQYWWRLLGAFAEDFRGLRAVLGARKFDHLAVAYLEAHGSTSWNLRDLGQHLEGFLLAQPALLAPHGPLALDMARVEWARIVAFDGPEKPPLDPQRLARKSPASLRLHLQPYLTLLALRYPIDELLRRQKPAETGTASNAVSGSGRSRRARLSARPLAQPLHLAIHRVDLSVYFKRLTPEAFQLLSALRAGETLEDACGLAFAQSSESPDTIANTVQTWFAAWMRFGWLCAR